MNIFMFFFFLFLDIYNILIEYSKNLIYYFIKWIIIFQKSLFFEYLYKLIIIRL